MNKVISSWLLFLCSLSLAGTLSAQGRPGSRRVPSPGGVNIQNLLLPHGSCGASSALPFADATTRGLWEQLLKTPSRPSAPTPALATRFLPRLIPNVDATSDVTVNATLSEGNVISGSIFGSGTPISITAWDTAGDSFAGTIDQQAKTFQIVVGPGIYNLTLCRLTPLPPFNFPGPTDTFPDPTPVDATQGDVTHDVTVPDLTLLDLQGSIMGIDPTLSNSVTFTSTDNMVGAFAVLDPSGHYGGFPLPFDLPAGTYTATLNEATTSSSFSSYVLGTVTITDSGMVPDLSKPKTTTLSGMASIAGTPPPANTLVFAAEPVTPPPPGSPPTCNAMPINRAFAIADSSGAFTLNVVNSTFQLSAFMTVLPVDPSTGQSDGIVNQTVQNVVVSGPTMQDIVAPPFPATSNVNGEVSDPLAMPVGNVDVSAFTNLTPDTIFVRASRTGSDGMYVLTVLANNPYTLGFSPEN